MRITVGGVLIITGIAVGGALAFNSVNLTSFERMTESVQKFREKILTTLGFGDSVDPAPVAPVKVETPKPLESPPSPPPLPEPAQSPTPQTAVIQQPAPTVAVSKKTRKRKARRKKPAPKKKVQKAAPAKAAPAASESTSPVTPTETAPPKPAKKTTGKNLTGSYVALTLKTGREVKGILQEQNASSYIVELPGLGVFTYPAENVTNVAPAE